jgi:hypothetical protein
MSEGPFELNEEAGRAIERINDRNLVEAQLNTENGRQTITAAQQIAIFVGIQRAREELEMRERQIRRRPQIPHHAVPATETALFIEDD